MALFSKSGKRNIFVTSAINGSRDIKFSMDLVVKDVGLFDKLANDHNIPLKENIGYYLRSEFLPQSFQSHDLEALDRL
jgi:hypothetical protein